MTEHDAGEGYIMETMRFMIVEWNILLLYVIQVDLSTARLIMNNNESNLNQQSQLGGDIKIQWCSSYGHRATR